MGKEKDLVRIFISDDDKLGISCNTDTEEEFDMVVKAVYSLLDEIPNLVEELNELCKKEAKFKSFILSLNNSKIYS